jgi:hypothetical protein
MPLRYVVLRHDGIDQPHFDLMFETFEGSALATWRSDEWPITSTTRTERIGDHRRDYLDYEGPLSGNRGFVRRVDAGTHVLRQLETGWEIALANGQALRLGT